MQITSTTQPHRLFKILLLLFFISIGYTQSLTAQNGCVSCTLKYPDNSNLPRSAQEFSESDVLVAFDPGPSICGKAPEYIKVWYSDEHALTLGVRQVIVKTAAGTTTTNYTVTPSPASPTCVDHPLVGTTAASGDQSGNDLAVDGGRPLWPAVFITDLTVNGASSRKGDWQQGGTGIAPSRVCGTWKAAVRTVDRTKSPEVVTVTPDTDPAKNDWNLGGGDTPPTMPKSEGYTAEVEWKLSDLNLIPGHSYRLQFMVHDGDQNKTGGDVGDTCTTMTVPLPASSIGDFAWDDLVGNSRINGVQDAGDTGLKNITVTLYDAAGNVKATTFTDSQGKYLFSNVDVSGGCTQYKVGFSPLPPDSMFTDANGKKTTRHYSWVNKHLGGDSTLDSDVNPNTGITDLFTICPGQSRLDIDAGRIYADAATLAVTISSFQGKFENGITALSWDIQSQDNLSSYEIQRSIDGVIFKNIGSVKVSANSNYTFNDNLPVAGTDYYRLKFVDKSGAFTYGNVIAINALIKGTTVRAVYPNPFRDQVKVAIASENAEPITIRIMDNVGRVIKQQSLTTQKGTNEVLISDLGALNPGLYIVEVKTPFTSVRTKINK